MSIPRSCCAESRAAPVWAYGGPRAGRCPVTRRRPTASSCGRETRPGPWRAWTRRTREHGGVDCPPSICERQQSEGRSLDGGCRPKTPETHVPRVRRGARSREPDLVQQVRRPGAYARREPPAGLDRGRPPLAHRPGRRCRRGSRSAVEARIVENRARRRRTRGYGPHVPNLPMSRGVRFRQLTPPCRENVQGSPRRTVPEDRAPAQSKR